MNRRVFAFLVVVLLAAASTSCSLDRGDETTETGSLQEPGTKAVDEHPPPAVTRLEELGARPTQETQQPQALAAGGPPAPTSLNVPLRVQNRSDVERTNEPVTSGLPLPKELNLQDVSGLGLVDAAGSSLPAQFIPLARWGGAPDDASRPVRWLLLDFQASIPARGETVYFLQETGPSPPPAHPLSITTTSGSLVVQTQSADGTALRFRLSLIDGRLSAPGLGDPVSGRISSGGVEHWWSGPVDVEVLLQGPVRSAVRVQGAYRDASGNSLLDYTSTYWFSAGRPTVRLIHTVENNTPCPLGGYEQISCMDIGSAGSVTFEDLSLILPVALGDRLTFDVGGQGATLSGSLSGDLRLVQDSSGLEHWDHYRTLTDWDGNPLDARPRMQAYVSFRGYRTTLADVLVDSGERAPGWLRVQGQEGAWAAGVRDYWQSFPKSLRAAPSGTLEIGLFPDEFGPPEYTFTLRAGEHKTHEVLLAPGGGIPVTEPLLAQASPEWYIDSGAFGLAALPDASAWPEHESYLRHQLDTAPGYEAWMDWHPNLYAALEATDFYGVFDYGDWPLDYEGYGVAPLNPKYHSGLGLWQQWARTGDVRWFALAEAANRHFADIDILHTLHSPRHWSDGIAFGHSYHDEAGFLNPHRNEGGLTPDTAWGLDGLLLTAYVTGYEKAFESAIELADCIEYRLRNDLHLCSAFPDCSGEGWALGEGLYADGSRPAANSLSIAVGAYRATGDGRYLSIADAIVDWARPQLQPYLGGASGGQGGDVFVKPWQLNLYLRALAGYVEMREEFGLPDTYDARGSYLTYANWLRDEVWLDLEPLANGPRAAFPYQWWLDGRQGDPNDEWATGNNIPDVSNWLLLGADVLAYAYRLSGDQDYLERSATLFRTGSRDPWYEGDTNTYSATKETVSSIVFGQLFLHEWSLR